MGRFNQELRGRDSGGAVEFPRGATLVAMDPVDDPFGLLLGSPNPFGDAGQVVLIGRGGNRELLAQDEFVFQELYLAALITSLFSASEAEGARGLLAVPVAQLISGAAQRVEHLSFHMVNQVVPELRYLKNLNQKQ